MKTQIAIVFTDKKKVIISYIRSITPLSTRYIKIMHQLWIENGMRELASQRLAVQVRNIKNKNILSTVERRSPPCSREKIFSLQ